MKHMLFERIHNWIIIKGQLEECNDMLEQNVATLKKSIKEEGRRNRDFLVLVLMLFLS